MNIQEMIGFLQRIEVMDVGASFITEVPVYKVLLDEGLAHLHAFEGDERQIEEIKQAYGNTVTVHSEFVGDGEQHTLYLAHAATGMTSLLKPNPTALAFFNGFDGFGQVLSTQPVQTRRLDSISDIPRVDFLKMDIQGSELSVLKHGTDTLQDCVAVQLEVSYICLYENQPSFGEIDVWMRKQGFAPHCFLDVKRWSIAPTVFQGNFRVPGNQLLESDIVYIKDPLALDQYSDPQLQKLALLAHYSFQSHDLCAFLLEEMQSRKLVSPDTRSRYYELLANP